MNDVPDDELRDALRRMSGAVQPTHAATHTIRDRVRRSRKRRALVAQAATVGLVMSMVGVGFVVGGALPGPREVVDAPSPEKPELFECETENLWDSKPPPIPDREAQEKVVSELESLSSVQVRHAAATHLGVMALVADESRSSGIEVDPAVAAKLREIGAAHVYRWDGPPDADWMRPRHQVEYFLDELLTPATQQIEDVTATMSGSAGWVTWGAAGLVQLQWKAPVPQEVLDLAGVRDDGVEVVVQAVDYSTDDMYSAMDDLEAALAKVDAQERYSTSFPCEDSSGIVVGIVPPVKDRAELESALAEEIGMPVMVEPWDAVTPMPGL